MTDPTPAPVAKRPRTELWTGTAVDQLLTGLGIDPRTVRYRVIVDQLDDQDRQRTVHAVADVERVTRPGDQRPAPDRLVDRVVEHLNTTPLRLDQDHAHQHPTDVHGSGHTYLYDCVVCRARDLPGALRMLVAEVLSFAEADARREDRLRRMAAVAEAFDVPVELLGAPRLGAIPMAHALEPENEHTDPGTPQPAPGVVHAYQWFIDPQFDGLTVACEEPITAAGLTATADRDEVTCPACLARIKVGDQ